MRLPFFKKILLCILLIGIISPRPAYADRRIVISPETILTNTASFQIQILASDSDVFNPTLRYVFMTWHDGDPPADCGRDPILGTISPDGKIATFNYSTTGLATGRSLFCNNGAGSWKFAIWPTTDRVFIPIDPPAGAFTGSYNIGENSNNPESPPSIYPAKNPYEILRETPEAILVNARDDSTYYFWWDGARIFSYSAVKQPGVTNMKIPLVLSGPLGIFPGSGAFDSPGPRKLCMMPVPYAALPPIPAQSACAYSTIFNFVENNANKNKVSCRLIPSNPDSTTNIILNASELPRNQNFTARLWNGNTPVHAATGDSGASGSVGLEIGNKERDGKYIANLTDASSNEICSINITIGKAGTAVSPPVCGPNNPNCTNSAGKFCANDKEIETAIGCIPTEPADLITGLVRFATAAGGGVALILMISGAFQMMTSGGNPDNVHHGQERFTSAVIGLLFIIFAILLLQVIGVDILALPGFIKSP